MKNLATTRAARATCVSWSLACQGRSCSSRACRSSRPRAARLRLRLPFFHVPTTGKTTLCVTDDGPRGAAPEALRHRARGAPPADRRPARRTNMTPSPPPPARELNRPCTLSGGGEHHVDDARRRGGCARSGRRRSTAAVKQEKLQRREVGVDARHAAAAARTSWPRAPTDASGAPAPVWSSYAQLPTARSRRRLLVALEAELAADDGQSAPEAKASRRRRRRRRRALDPRAPATLAKWCGGPKRRSASPSCAAS